VSGDTAQSTSLVEVPADSQFSLANLPYGVFAVPGRSPRVGVAIGDRILDLAAVAELGLLVETGIAPEVFAQASLNPLLAAGRVSWEALRRRLMDLLSMADPTHIKDNPELLVLRRDARLLLPFTPGDYIDFYSSLEHATNLGRLFRPGTEPLPPSWRHLPIGYHGRAGSIVVSGTEVRRPWGQIAPREAGEGPGFCPSAQLDIEVELAFVTGAGPGLGQPIPTERAADHIFGFVLMNDWSARDLQRWEYQPLGPFLGKSFATSISPWVVPLQAVRPRLVPGPAQDPPPLPHLRCDAPWNLDLELDVTLQPGSQGAKATPITRTNARGLYWNAAQQLAHATSNGAAVRPGDLFASGTISGPAEHEGGSLIELTWGGQRPLELADGSQRRFLEDGDEIVISGTYGLGLGFGEVAGRIAPAEPPDSPKTNT
jgi:fumarylacetoacetase